ncbi:MAG: hypothetical protein WBZ19_19640 [Chthoniobacterales bacterium]
MVFNELFYFGVAKIKEAVFYIAASRRPGSTPKTHCDQTVIHLLTTIMPKNSVPNPISGRRPTIMREQPRSFYFEVRSILALNIARMFATQEAPTHDAMHPIDVFLAGALSHALKRCENQP